MTEADLIKRIQLLKNVKPREDWVSLTKKEIFGDEIPANNKFSQVVEVLPRVNFWRVLVPAFSFCLPFILLAVSQNALPGDTLYPVKKLTEKSQAYFVSKDKLAEVQLGMANRRLEDLNKIAQTSQTNKLIPALAEYQASISEAVKNLAQVKKTDIKEIVQQTKKLEENKQKAEALGVVIGGTNELNSALATLADREIKDLESRMLNEAQQELLAEAKENFEAGNYSQALEKILQATQIYE